MDKQNIERDQRIPIQVTEAEKHMLQEAALKTGLPVSTFIRMKMLRIAKDALQE